MHDTVFFAAVAWMTVLLVAVVGLIVRRRAPLSRLLALDTLALILVALLLLYGDANRDAAYLDVALVLALVSFVATLAAANYHARGRPFP
jgi:multicomponent Na+:H+ antiporter subunit F